MQMKHPIRNDNVYSVRLFDSLSHHHFTSETTIFALKIQRDVDEQLDRTALQASKLLESTVGLILSNPGRTPWIVC
jgi:hypothetical protein